MDGSQLEVDGLTSLIRTKQVGTLVIRVDPQFSPSVESRNVLETGVRVFWEIVNVAELTAVRAARLKIDGWIVAGEEAGGRIGSLSTPLLLQSVIAAGVLDPIFARGGFGPVGAAGLILAGASGVVWDDQLLAFEESPLGNRRRLLASISGQDCVIVGGRSDIAYRILCRPEMPASLEIVRTLRQLEASDADDRELAVRIRGKMESQLSWEPGEGRIWPLGQAAAVATDMAARFGRVGKMLRSFSRLLDRIYADLTNAFPFAGSTSLADRLEIRWPVVQGPMTRLSDEPLFAKAIAEQGALPTLALALTRAPRVQELLQRTRDALGAKPWAVGILGYAPREIWQEQLSAITAVRPRVCIISGARANQCAEVEALGIKVYVHAPSIFLLQGYIKDGIRRFIFEGRESGGHVGPLGSLLLWEQACDVICRQVAPEERSKIDVLFAGGIHDDRSSIIAAAFATGLAKIGTHVGILMGTAYALTVEALEAGALTPEFQRQTLSCDLTSILDLGSGHQIRCAPTEFCGEFNALRRKLMQQGKSTAAIQSELETLSLGRLRLAVKGHRRNADGTVERIDTIAQGKDGLYMIGQAACLISRIRSISAVHAAVSDEPVKLLKRERRRFERPASAGLPPSPSDIAIIGVSCVAPGAADVQSYWSNLLELKSSITEIPMGRFDWKLYYSEDPQAKDRIISKWGGFIDDVIFDPVAFGIPPNFTPSICPAHLLTLEGVRLALEDASLTLEDADRAETEVIVGNCEGGGFLRELLGARTIAPLIFGNVPEVLDETLPQWNSESFTGTLDNLASGRVANRFDFGGINLTVDAACASSLAAVDIAVRDLETGRCNLAIVGAADCTNTPSNYIAFSKTQALSVKGKVNTFDEQADGIVISEGAGFVVLKRLKDAERDGDRIYAVIKSIAGSSDGKSSGLTAPKVDGQLRALDRAYKKAGFLIDSIQYYEAHGTGTALGDRTEVATISRALVEAGARPLSCALGSHKALIGHTKAAAGILGLIKVAKALFHQAIPPHVTVENPLEQLRGGKSVLTLPDRPRVWPSLKGAPRRAGVSAFGFGGINYHAVMEEHDAGFGKGSAGHSCWPVEIFVLHGASPIDLGAKIETILDAAVQTISLLDYSIRCCELAGRYTPEGVSLGFTASSLQGARELFEAAKIALVSGTDFPSAVHCRSGRGTQPAGKLAVLFPGQGVQHPGMFWEPIFYLDVLRTSLQRSGTILKDTVPEGIFSLIDPSQALAERDSESKPPKTLTETHLVQPALAAVSVAVISMLDRSGLKIDMVAGHSLGELLALHQAGALRADHLLQIVAERGRQMSDANRSGGMAAVSAEKTVLDDLLLQFPGLAMANLNSPRQYVLSGPTPVLQELVQHCRDRNIVCTKLPVGGAFHSIHMDSASRGMASTLEHTFFQSPKIPVYSNQYTDCYPTNLEEIRKRIASQIISPVRFGEMIKRMYQDGARVFLDAGPRGLFKTLLGENLIGCDYRLISLDDGKGRLKSLLEAFTELSVSGKIESVGWTHDGRTPSTVTIASKNEPDRSHEFRVNGMFVHSAARPHYGEKPLRPDPRALASLHNAATTNGSSGSEDGGVTAYLAYQETMRGFLQLQEKVTLALLSAPERAVSTNLPDPLSSSNPMVGKAAPQSENVSFFPAAESTPQAVLSLGNIAKALIGIVSAKTGYSPDTLKLDAEIDGELGIDSIRKLEIISDFTRRLPELAAARVREQVGRLSQAKTLREILTQIENAFSVLEQSPASADPAKQAIAANGNSTGLRFILQSHAQALDLTDKKNRLYVETSERSANSICLLVGAKTRLIEQVAEQFEADGYSTHLATFDMLEGKGSEIEILIGRLRAQGRTIRQLVFLPDCSSLNPDTVSFENWERSSEYGPRLFFRLVKACANDLVTAPPSEHAFLAILTTLGGQFGRGSTEKTSPMANACVAIARTFSAEMPNVSVKIIDLALPENPHDIIHIVASSLFKNQPRLELGLSVLGQTTSIVASAERPVPREVIDHGFVHGDVILAIGGTGGIMGSLLKKIAKAGLRIVVVGRSRLSQPVEDTPRPNHNAATSEPNNYARGAIRDQEKNAVLAEIRNRGAEVDYVAGDMSRENVAREIIENTYLKYKKIDYIFHAGGIIEDRLLHQKSLESFDRVFKTKSNATYLLAKYGASESLKAFVFFSSISAQFGNPGQVDYAAGNELLNGVALGLHRRWPKCHVVSINWGPWKDVGMAAGALESVFRRRGVEPIDPEQGVKLLLDELAGGRSDDVEIIAGIGPWVHNRRTF